MVWYVCFVFPRSTHIDVMRHMFLSLESLRMVHCKWVGTASGSIALGRELLVSSHAIVKLFVVAVGC